MHEVCASSQWIAYRQERMQEGAGAAEHPQHSSAADLLQYQQLLLHSRCNLHSWLHTTATTMYTMCAAAGPWHAPAGTAHQYRMLLMWTAERCSATCAHRPVQLRAVRQHTCPTNREHPAVRLLAAAAASAWCNPTPAVATHPLQGACAGCQRQTRGQMPHVLLQPWPEAADMHPAAHLLLLLLLLL
jgi:hypothetical protein